MHKASPTVARPKLISTCVQVFIMHGMCWEAAIESRITDFRAGRPSSHPRYCSIEKASVKALRSKAVYRVFNQKTTVRLAREQSCPSCRVSSRGQVSSCSPRWPCASDTCKTTCLPDEAKSRAGRDPQNRGCDLADMPRRHAKTPSNLLPNFVTKAQFQTRLLFASESSLVADRLHRLCHWDLGIRSACDTALDCPE
jgi:hypothetical protein